MQHSTERRSTVSPLGPLALVAEGDRLTEVRLPGEAVAVPSAAIRAGLVEKRGPGSFTAGSGTGEGTTVLTEAASQLAAYFSGRLHEFDLPLALRGTPFRLAVWRELLHVPYGTTVTYADLAARIGRPGAARAVGRAVGQNPLAIVVPCHRVIGADRRLTGYAGGLEAKAMLLRLEAGAVA